MQIRKDKENKKLAQDFKHWKKQSKEKINLMKKENLLKTKFMSGF